jgi:diaminopropionate ammonia-lyase
MRRHLVNPFRRSQIDVGPETVAAFESRDVAELHGSIPAYRPTPLVELPALAHELGLSRIFVKDEAHRFGLKAFKALGGTYATYRFVSDYLAKAGRSCPLASQFFSRHGFLLPGELTFCTATDGNHGRGVAWVARLLQQKAVIFMPRGTVQARIDNTRSEGAEVYIVDGVYDDAVSRCAQESAAKGWQIISDMSWSGYEQIPRWIMAGYLTLFREVESVVNSGYQIDCVIIQAGAGALAGAAVWHFRQESPWQNTKIVSVEPTESACLLESIESPGREPVLSKGRQDSTMAGLNCGTPSLVAWPLIRQGFDLFLAISDTSCVQAMRRYYYPTGGDQRIVSGESGAAGLAALLDLMTKSEFREARSYLGLGPKSTVLLLNTEGDTDPAGFARRVLNKSLS